MAGIFSASLGVPVMLGHRDALGGISVLRTQADAKAYTHNLGINAHVPIILTCKTSGPGLGRSETREQIHSYDMPKTESMFENSVYQDSLSLRHVL